MLTSIGHYVHIHTSFSDRDPLLKSHWFTENREMVFSSFECELTVFALLVTISIIIMINNFYNTIVIH